MNTSLARINAAAERGQMRDQVIAPILAAVRRLRMGRDPARTGPRRPPLRTNPRRVRARLPDVDTVAEATVRGTATRKFCGGSGRVDVTFLGRGIRGACGR
jgi:hypothetical protein